MATTKKPAAKKSTAKKPAAKKSTAKKPAAKKSAAKKPAAKKVSSVKGKSVEWYISTLNGWQQDVVGKLAALVAAEAPKATSSIKWAQPVWEHFGPFAFVRASRNHVTLGFWRGAELTDARSILEGAGERMKHLKIFDGKGIDDSVKALVREAVALNEKLGDPTRG